MVWLTNHYFDKMELNLEISAILRFIRDNLLIFQVKYSSFSLYQRLTFVLLFRALSILKLIAIYQFNIHSEVAKEKSSESQFKKYKSKLWISAKFELPFTNCTFTYLLNNDIHLNFWKSWIIKFFSFISMWFFKRNAFKFFLKK